MCVCVCVCHHHHHRPCASSIASSVMLRSSGAGASACLVAGAEQMARAAVTRVAPAKSPQHPNIKLKTTEMIQRFVAVVKNIHKRTERCGFRAKISCTDRWVPLWVSYNWKVFEVVLVCVLVRYAKLIYFFKTQDTSFGFLASFFKRFPSLTGYCGSV